MEPETKEIEIMWNGKKEKAIIKKLTYGEKWKLWDETTTTKMVGGQPTTEASQYKLRIGLLVKTLVKAPFTIDAKTIDALPDTVGDKIYKEAEDFNLLSLEKKDS